MRGQSLFVDARPVVKAFELGQAGELEQVLVARHVLGQQQQVVGLLVLAGQAVGHLGPRQVALHTDDGLDARVGGGLPELHRAVHHPVIGQRQGGLAQRLGPRHELRDARQAVEERVFGMAVEVDKGHNGWRPRDSIRKVPTGC